MRIIAIIIIALVVLVILIKDYICFTKDENDDDEETRECYHIGDW